MEDLTLHKLKKGMSFDDSLVAICDGVIGLIFILPEICNKAAKILGEGRTPFCILNMLDAMEIYGNDLGRLYVDVCHENQINLMTVVWAVEVGAKETKLGNDIPEFAKTSTIKQMIADLKKWQEPNFPFEEAKKYIEENSLVRFPAETKPLRGCKKNGLFSLIIARPLASIKEFFTLTH